MERRWVLATQQMKWTINIAICDDDRIETGIVEEMLRMVASEQGIKINCDVFFDGASLLEAIRDQGMCFELVYMDIMMKDMDGIHTAQVLREMSIPALIVYISAYEDYLIELFCTEPFRFLKKPLNVEEFRKVFFNAYERIRRTAYYFTFSYNRVLYKMPFDRIVYFESNDRVISIHMDGVDNGTMPDRFYGKMNDVDNYISSMNKRFLRIHQSFLVNFDQIKKFAYTNVTMLDGSKLKISGERQKSVKECFYALLGKRGENAMYSFPCAEGQ